MTYAPWNARRIGIEMEVTRTGRADTSLSTTSIADAMHGKFNEAMLSTANINDTNNGWRNSNGRTWDIKTDSSCGLEIASPAMMLDTTGHNPELRATCAALTSVAKVDRRCGVHVHVDVSDFDRATFQRLLALWYRYEPFFFGLVAPSRARNMFCLATRSTEWTRNTGDLWHTAHAATALHATNDNVMQRALQNIGHWGQKYRAMNIAPYPLHGRIEFRLHHGTIDYTKLRMWAMWLTTLVQRAKTGQHVADVRRQVPEPLDPTTAFGRRGGFTPRYMGVALGLRTKTQTYFAEQPIVEELCTWADSRRATFQRDGSTEGM